ncbi:MAG: hypothetical protein NTZ32_20530 [Planctomycetales bacterium]|nr:hypothetical protein [Planctomycetales bacterium]
MSLKNLSTCSRKSAFTSLLATVIAVGAVVWLTNGSPEAPQVVAAQSSKPKADAKHNEAEHAADTAALKQVFAGSTVDLYFESGELDTVKPGLSGLKFVDHVDVTGKELLRFEKGTGDTWLIDPDTVFAFRARKGK